MTIYRLMDMKGRAVMSDRKPWILAIDLDGILAKPISSDKYEVAIPISENIEKVNKLFDLGHRIMIYTARGWFLYDLTEKWLKKNNVKYTQLVMGKLYCHANVDDMNYTLEEITEKLK